MTFDADAYLASLDSSLTSGLYSDFTGTLINCKFDYDAGYRDGEVLAFWADITDIDDPEIGDDGVLTHQRFSIGNDWITQDDGKSACRADGKKGKWNTQTGIGVLFESLMKLEDFRQAVVNRAAAGDTITPLEARFFEGVRGHFSRTETREFTAKDGKKGTAGNNLFIDEFHGIVSGGVAGGVAGGAVAAPVAQAAAPVAAPAAAAPVAAPVAQAAPAVPAPTPAAPPPAAAPAPAPQPASDAGDAEDALNLALHGLADQIVASGGGPDDFLTAAYTAHPDVSGSPVETDLCNYVHWNAAVARYSAANG